MAYLSTVKLSETQTWRNQDERRYELSRETAESVLPLLTANLPVMRYGDAPPTTLVATLYYDTVDGYFLQRAKSTSGISSLKIRAREYLPISDDAERKVLGVSEFCYLERKEREGTIRQKDRLKLDKSQLDLIMAGVENTGYEILQHEIRTRTLVPAVISMYERRVWGSDSGLRVTFDERIRYYRPPSAPPYQTVHALQPSELGEPVSIGPKRMLEVKYAAKQALPEWLTQLSAGLREACGFSKFLDGMAGMQSRRRHSTALTRPVFKLNGD